MSDKKKLIASVIQFLTDEQQTSQLSPDAKESLEVAIQCLQSAYDVNTVDPSLLSSKKLIDIFREAISKDAQIPKPKVQVSEEVKAEAERLKNEGNNLMKAERYADALQCYTKAIELDGSNAVFYCNRAAAYTKLDNHHAALKDCQTAISSDPNYSKAYGRMGLAYASLNDHQRARDCYKKAIELDPENESYKNNLRIAEEKLAENPFGNIFGSMFGGGGGGGQGFGGQGFGGQGFGGNQPQGGAGAGANPFDPSQIFGNPMFLNFANQLMRDPAMQNLLGGLMTQLGPANPNPNPSQNPDAQGASAPGFEQILQVGQQFAEQLQAANPELIEQLRNTMGARTAPEGGEQNDQQKDSNNSQEKKD